MRGGEQAPGEASSRLAELLKRLMHRKGMRQADLARVAGISPAAVSNALNPDKGVPSVDTLDRLAVALKISDSQRRELNELRGWGDGVSRRLDAYLTAAAHAAKDQHYPGVLPGSTPPLAAVYVRQHANPVTAGNGGQGGMVHEAPLLETLPADEVLDGSMSCVVLGGPGGGKTSLLRQRMSADLVRDDQGNLLAVPVLVPAAALIGKPLAAAIADAANADLAPWLLEELPNTFFSSPPAAGTKWLLLVDGLDEIADTDARQRVLRTLAAVDSGKHGDLFRFVVATRPLPRDELNTVGQDVALYVLEPFRPGDLVKVARAWFSVSGLTRPEAEAARFVQALGDTRLAALARLPLMASLLCQIHAADPQRPLPLSRGQIYDAFIGLLYKRQHTPHAPGSPRQLCARLSRYGAQATADAERYLDTLPQAIERLAAQRQQGSVLSTLGIVGSLPESRCPSRVPADEWRGFLGESLRHSGLLTLRAGNYVFLHHTLQEHLSARHTVRANAPDLNEFTEQLAERAEMTISERHLMTSDYSYLGFILDAAYESGLRACNDFWARLSGEKTLGAHQRIAALAVLGTRVPPLVHRAAIDWVMELAATAGTNEHAGRAAVRAVADLRDSLTADRLHALASHRGRQSAVRVEAAQRLASLGDHRTADLLHRLACDRDLDGSSRLALAWELDALGDPRTTSLLDELVQDTSLGSASRNAAAQKVASVGASHAGGLLHGLARDMDLSDTTRLMVTRALIRTVDPGLPDLLHDLALDPSIGDPARLTCAAELAMLADARIPGLLEKLGGDPSLRGSSRNLAVQRLAEIKAPPARNLWLRIAADVALPGAIRVEAACRMAPLGDPAVADLLEELARDPDMPGAARVEAAGRLAGLRDVRAVKALSALANDERLTARQRVTAATRLAMTEAPEAADLLHGLASISPFPSAMRAEAGRQLAIHQDPRAAYLLEGLARDAGLEDAHRWEAAVALRELSDERGLDIFRQLAADATLQEGFRRNARLVLRTAGQREHGEPRSAADRQGVKTSIEVPVQPTSQRSDGRGPRGGGKSSTRGKP